MAGKKGRSGGARAGAGRKRLPTEVKRLKGTLQKCRTNPLEPQQSGGLLCDPPTGMREAAADIWRFLIENTPKGVLHGNNAPVLERYCEIMAVSRLLANEISKRGPEGIDNKLIKLQLDISSELRALEAELGFTPASRSRVQVPIATPIDEDDPWANF